MEAQIKKAIELLKKYQYEPKAVWLSLDNKQFYVVSDDEDRTPYLKLLRKLQDDKER